MFDFLKRKKKAAAAGAPKPVPSSSLKQSLLSLEQRLMFDAAAAATAAEVKSEQVAQDQAEAAVSAELSADRTTADQADSQELLQAIVSYTPGESTTEVAFVDPTVPDYQSLIAGMGPNVEVVMLDAARDGVEQIAESLAGRSGIDAIHLISHGNSGELQLGAGTLNTESMSGKYANELSTIQQSLSEQADILIYGCDFAEGERGQTAVIRLAELTGTDVQASTDATGHISLGGDWEFEVQTGTIETQIVITEAVQVDWVGLLATETVKDTFSSDSYSNNNGTQSWSTSWSETDAGGGGASGGDVRVNSSQLRIDTDTVGNAISRGVNLSGATSATLTFDYTNALLGADRIEVRVSTDGGANYSTLGGGIFSSAANTGSGAASLDLSGYMSANTRIQFIVTGTGGGERLYVDNVQISYQTNSAPTITSLSGDSLSYSESDGAVVLEQGANALVSDSDSANFDTGTLTVSIPSGGDSAEDVLAIRNQGTSAGQIGVSGSTITYGGTTIGTFTGGSSGANLVITLNSNATPTAVTALVKNITYENTDTNAPTTGARTVRYVLTDGDGGTSANYDTTVTVSAVNDAPVLADTALSLTVGEDAGAPSGAVGSLISTFTGGITDVDSGASKGIAITGTDETNGTWYYTTNGGSTWTAVGAVSNTSALLLADNGSSRLYFSPSADYNGTISNAITVRAWDQTSGSNGARVSLPTSSNTVLDSMSSTSFSSNNGTANWSGSWIENDAGGAGATTGNIDITSGYLRFRPATVGNSIAREVDLSTATSATFSFSMPATFLTTGQILVQVSNNGGASYTTLETITSASSTGTHSYDISSYLASNTRIRFYASVVDSSGIRIDDVHVQYNNTTGGGTTAFSSATDTVNVTVTAVNDAPTITSLSGDSLSYSEGAGAVVIEQGGNALVADVDSTNLDTGTLTVSIPSGGDSAEDVLSIRNQGTGAGQIGVSGGNVTYQGVTIGTFTGGSSGSNLVITLNSNATPTAVTALVKNITYQNTDTSAPTTGARTVRYVLTDGDGGTSANYDTTVTVGAANDAPTFSVGDGQALTSFGSGWEFGKETVIQPDGKILVGGYSDSGGSDDFSLVRYNVDGTLDTSFGGGDGVAFAGIVGRAEAMVLQADGKVVLSGYTTTGGYQVCLVQFNADGSLDTSFGGGDGIASSGVSGSAKDVALQTDGKFLVAADLSNSNFNLMRFNSDGSLDTSFGGGSGYVSTDLAGSNDRADSLTIQSDGKVLLSGFGFNGTSFDFALVRYNTDGSLDTSFNGTGKVLTDFGANSSDMGNEVRMQADGKIVVAGWSNTGGTNDFAIARYNANGTLDAGFGSGGKVTINLGGSDLAEGLTIQADGKILVTGTAGINGGDVGLVRLNTDGTLDTAFGGGDGIITSNYSGSSDDRGYSVAVQSDGRIVVSGTTQVGGLGGYNVALNRYSSTGSLDTTFDPVNTLNGTPTYTEGGSPVVLDADVQIFDAELSALNNFDGATLTLARNGGANAEDQLVFDGTVVTVSGPAVSVSGVQVGTYTFTGGEMTIAFNGNATQARVNTLMQHILYSNVSDTPPASAQIDWTFSDGNTGSQGTGGALQATGSTTVTIIAVNDAPTITILSGDSLSYSEGSGAVVIEQGGNALVADVDSANFDTGTLTVSIPAGSDSAEDVLSILNQGTGAGQIGVSGSNVTYQGVTIGTFAGGSSGSNLVITLNSNASPSAVTALVKNITYQNTDTNAPTTGARTVRYVLTDGDGGTSANYDTTVTVSGVNDAPTDMSLSANTVAENAANGTVVGTVTGTDPDSGDTKAYSLTDTAGGRFAIDSSTGAITVADGSLLNYEAATNHTVTVRVTDSGGLTYDESFTINLTNVNEAPTGADATITLTEDTAHTLTTANFGFSDVDVGDSLSAVRIDALPGAGTLTLSGVTVTAGQVVTVADITAGNLVFTPVADANGTGYASLTFSVRDSTSAYDTAPNSLTFDVTAVNDAPTRTAGTVSNLTVSEDAGLASLGLGGVTYSLGGGADESGQTLMYAVTAIPSASVGDVFLADGTTRVTVGSYSLADIQGMQFKPAANASGITAFQFNVYDSGGTANGGADNISQFILITVTAVNDAPTITSLSGDSLSYSEGAGPLVIEQSANALVADVDSTNFDTGTLTVSIPAGGDSAEDVLSIQNQGTGAGQIGVSGSNVTYQGVTIGTFTGGSSGANLVITLNSNATPTAVTALVKNITYENTDTNAPTTGARTVRYVLTDGDGGTSANYDTTVTVSGVNDAPVNTVPGAQTVAEDTALAIGGISVTDVDGNLSTVQLAVGNGTVAVTLAGGATISAGSNGTNTLTLSGSQADINATLASLSYQGTADYNGADTLTVTSTDANAVTDVDTVAITVTAQVDYPSGADNTVTTLEDVPYTLTVADFGFSDPDVGDSMVGVVINTLPASGTLTLNGSTFVAGTFVAVADISSGSLVFTPPGDAAGTNLTSFTFSVLDSTVLPDWTPNTLTIDVTPVNDAPVITPLAPDVTFIEGGLPQAFDATGTIVDADSANFDGGVLTISISANGTVDDRLIVGNWGTGPGQVGTSGSNVTYEGVVIGTVSGGMSGSDPLVVTFNTSATPSAVQEVYRSIQFENVSDTPSTATRTLTIGLTDGDGGTATPQNKLVYVQATNDAPVVTFGEGDKNFTEGALAVMIDTLPNVSDLDSTDFDAGTLTITISANPSVDDRVELLNTGMGAGQIGVSGTNVYYGGTLIGTQGGGIGAVPFVVTFNANADATIVGEVMANIRFWVAGDAPSTATRTVEAVLTDGDGGASLTASKQITVTAANDAPTITSLSGDSLSYSEGDGAVVIEQGGNALVADVDSTNFDTGTLTVLIPAGGDSAEDVLSIQNQGTGAGQIGVSGSNVTYQGVAIGTFTGGSGGTDLVITLNSSATPTAVTVLVKTITYENTDTSTPTTGARTVRYVLTDGDGGTSANYDTTVTVSGVNDAPTDLALSANTVTENAADGTVVGTVTGTDVDAGDTKSYSLTDTAGGRFAINSSTGQITVANSSLLNYEAATSHTVTVRVTDSGGLTYDEAFTINLSNVNEAPNGADATVTINEDTSHTLTAANFGFSDVDAGDSLSAVRIDTLLGAGTLTLSGVTVTAGQVVSVADITAGNLVFTPAADANGTGYANFTFSVRDSNSTYDAAPNTLTFNVTAVNDAPVNTVPGAQTVNEDTALNISGVSVTDVDGNLSTVQLAVGNGTLNVTLAGAASISAGSNGSATLTLSGSQADINATLASLSYQGTADYNGADTLTITSTDANAVTDVDTVAITVTAANDAPTDLALSANTVAENAVNGTVVGTVTGIDVDAGDTKSYSLINTAGGRFAINSSTGMITVADGTLLNYESATSHSVTVRVTDSGGLTYDEAFTINLTNVNEAPTAIALSGSAVAENAANGTVVGTASTTDVDAGDLHTYQLMSNAGGRFAIDNNTGVITVADGTLLDYEVATSHTITIRTTDAGGLTHDQVLSIAMTDVNEATTTTTVPGPLLPGTPPSPTGTPASPVTGGSVGPVPVDGPVPGPAPTPTVPPPDAARSVSLPMAPRVPLSAVHVLGPGHIQEGEKPVVLEDDREPIAWTIVEPVLNLLHEAADQLRTLAQSPEIPAKLSEFIVKELDAMTESLEQAMEGQQDEETLIAATAAGVSIVFSTGYVVWALRGGWLLASLLATMPAWRSFDPLPVLVRAKEDRDQQKDKHDDRRAARREDEQIEHLFGSDEGRAA